MGSESFPFFFVYESHKMLHLSVYLVNFATQLSMNKIIQKLKYKWNIESDLQLLWIFIIFAITGSSIVFVRKPITEYLFDKSTYGHLSWYELIITIIIVYFIYQIFLFVIGSILGQHKFVKWFVIKMNKRLFFIKTKK